MTSQKQLKLEQMPCPMVECAIQFYKCMCQVASEPILMWQLGRSWGSQAVVFEDVLNWFMLCSSGVYGVLLLGKLFTFCIRIT